MARELASGLDVGVTSSVLADIDNYFCISCSNIVGTFYVVSHEEIILLSFPYLDHLRRYYDPTHHSHRYHVAVALHIYERSDSLQSTVVHLEFSRLFRELGLACDVPAAMRSYSVSVEKSWPLVLVTERYVSIGEGVIAVTCERDTTIMSDEGYKWVALFEALITYVCPFVCTMIADLLVLSCHNSSNKFTVLSSDLVSNRRAFKEPFEGLKIQSRESIRVSSHFLTAIHLLSSFFCNKNGFCFKKISTTLPNIYFADPNTSCIRIPSSHPPSTLAFNFSSMDSAAV
ncbi:unnamed protein product [Angiostrongylus costaricensis]|uniref:DUF3480 domain-containing protein n=1 Tax=Angiostrongylus costaricensis TaxID=334426 RepID=A0A158PL59_ANGCS|nr:unnamed protein product [Angiostrongylus costaricensis]